MNTLLTHMNTPATAAPLLGGGACLPWDNHRPLVTACEERRFVSELRCRAGDVAAQPRRSDLTVVLNALRGGLTLDELIDFAPGVVPARLLAAYVDLDRRRVGAVEAWAAIVAEPSVSCLERNRVHASAIVPVLIDRLQRVATIDPDALGGVVERFDARIVEQRLAVWRLEFALEPAERATTDQLMVGRLLYDGSPDCVAAGDEFIADRVGLLSPTRVEALLRLPDPGR